jgi:broad specificity phosphatase PhoE
MGVNSSSCSSDSATTRSLVQHTPFENSISKNICFIRHGEGTHNVYGRLPGNYLRESLEDANLTEKGIQQAKELNKQLIDSQICHNATLVIVSPMRRTLDTAMTALSHLIEQNITCIALECIREVTGLYPCDRRLPITQHRTAYPSIDFTLIEEENDPLWGKYTMRETYEDVISRCYNFLDFLTKCDHQSIVVVTHSAFLRVLLQDILQVPQYQVCNNNNYISISIVLMLMFLCVL